MGISICILAMLKLMDVEAFGTSYKRYDLISSTFDGWIYIFPFCELLIGISFLNSSPPFPIVFIALILGITGMISIFKAVYLDTLKILKKKSCAIGVTTKTAVADLSKFNSLELPRFDTNDFPQ